MTNLNKITEGYNKFYGPAVLSILTHKNIDECAAVISKITGSYKITGVFTVDLLKAASLLGFDSELVHQNSSLFMALTTLRKRKLTGRFIVSLTNHFVVIEITDDGKIYFCDNHTKEPMPAASSARLTQTVVQIHKVWKIYQIPVIEPQLTRIRISARIKNDDTIEAVKYSQWNNGSSREDVIGTIKFCNVIELSDFIKFIRSSSI